MRASLHYLAIAGLFAACSSSDSGSATGPDSRTCTKGSLASPEVKTGTLTATSCSHFDPLWTSDIVPYDSYDLTVEAGKGYMFTLESPTDSGWDGVLELVAKSPVTGGEQLLSVSDDDGHRYFAQLYFIAPVSGTFSLRAQGRNMLQLGDYTLRSAVCAPGLPQVTVSIAATSQSLAATDCVVSEPRFAGSPALDSSRVKLYSIVIGPNEKKQITVTSAAFAPRFMVFGPGWGVPCDLGYDGCGGGAVMNPTATATADTTIWANGALVIDGNEIHHQSQPGWYTLAVGGSAFTDLGAFTLTVTQTQAPSAAFVLSDVGISAVRWFSRASAPKSPPAF